MKPHVLQFIVLAILLVVTVVVLALTIAVYVQITSGTGDRGGQGGTTEAPATTTGATTGTGGPTSPSFYNGQFADWTRAWNSDLANPKSSLFMQTAATYEDSVKKAFVAANGQLYSTSQVTVNRFRGQHLDTTRTATDVEFVIAVDGTPTLTEVENDLRKGAQLTQNDWRSVAVGETGLEPLPEPGHSDGWNRAAQMFLASINTSVDPCQNFFSFSCDKYIVAHPLGGRARQSTFDELQTSIYHNLTDVFEHLGADAPSDTLKLAANIYGACKSVGESTFQGPKLVLDIATEYGGWPVLDSTWSYDKVPHGIFWSMGDMTIKYGTPTLLNPGAGIDVEQIARHILYVDQAELAIPAIYYMTPSLSERYQDLLRSMIYQTVRGLGGTVDNATLLPEIDRMVAIEYRLAQISVPSAEQRNMSLGYNPYTVQQAQTQFPQIDWTPYFQGLIHSVFSDEPAQLLNPFVIAEPTRYTRDLDNYLGEIKADQGKMRDLVNYVIYRLVSDYMEFAGPEMARAKADFLRLARLPGGTSPWPNDPLAGDVEGRELECVQYLVSNFIFATGRLYIDSSFPAQNRDDVQVMINNVLSAFSSSLSGLNWMDNPSALNAYQKVSGLIRNVAYPDFEQNDAQLDAFYRSLIDASRSIDPKDPIAYYHYSLAMTNFLEEDSLRNLKRPSDRRDFGSPPFGPATVNAWYDPSRNSITFPAAILNEPFYRFDFPQAVNYGGLGVVMGHELSHGFDDQGVQFDWDGTLHTWMTPNAEAGFKQMAQCVVDEYSKFCYPELDQCINGVTTQGENIGDNGGLKAAYRAYKAYTASHGEEMPLPGLETYTMDQIFFMSYAQVWCGSYSSDALLKQLLTNPHSPGKDRVIGAVQNFPKFAEAFGCKKGDPMYPVSACDVW